MLLQKKLVSSYSIPVNQAIHLISVDPNTEPVGSFAYKVLFPGDIDIREQITACCNKAQAVQKIARDIKNIVRKIVMQPGYYLADFKAGLSPDGQVLRWNESELVKGYKFLPNGIRYTLEEASEDPTIVKIDAWAPINGRYVEVSNFMILMYVDAKGKKHLLNGEQPDYVESIKNDIITYFSQDSLNAFKATKRMMLLAKAFEDNYALSKILPLIDSGAGSLYQIISDMNTIYEMVEKLGNAAPYDFLWKEIDQFKDRLSYIFEFKFDDQMVNNIINNIVMNKLTGEALLEQFDILIDYLLGILNEYVLKYDINNGLYPPPLGYY